MTAPYSSSSLKKSTLHFLSGKVISALLSFLLLVLLIRLLDSHAYGAYATLIALLEVGYAVGNLGIGWVCQIYLPNYRLNAARADLAKFVWSILIVRSVALISVAFTVYSVQELLGGYLHLQNYSVAFSVYCLVLVAEGLGRVIRDEIMAALIQQKLAQSAVVFRNLILLALVSGFSGNGFDLAQLAWFELFASLGSLIMSLAGIGYYLSTLNDIRNQGWQSPRRRKVAATAISMYFSFLLSMATGTQIFTFLVNRFLGLEAAAVFGFARNLNDFLRRYLPAELLMGLILPKLVADYTEFRDMKRLSRHALLTWKISLGILIPAIGFFLICGGHFADLLSAGKYSESGFVITGLALALIPTSQRRILEAMVNILGRPAGCVKASIVALLALPMTLILVQYGLEIWAIVIGIIVAESLFNLVLIVHLRHIGCPYNVTFSMMVKLIMTVIIVAMALLPIAHISYQGWPVLMLEVGVAFLISLLVGWDLKFFTVNERQDLIRMLRPKWVTNTA